MKKELITKKGHVYMSLCDELLNLQINKTLPSIKDLSHKYQVGRGTVQEVVNQLIEDQLIEVLKNGRKGTKIVFINYQEILKIVVSDQLFVTMPLPYTTRYEGLATAIKETLQKQTNLKVNLLYAKEVKTREKLLENRSVQFAIFSEYDALKLIEKNPNLSILTKLESNSYLSKHVKVINSQTINKIGIDLDSAVHTKLIQKYFPLSPKINMPYNLLKRNLDRKIIGQTILNFDDLKNENYFYEEIEEDPKFLRAVIVINNSDKYYQKILDCESIRKNIKNIQEAIITQKVDPSY